MPLSTWSAPRGRVAADRADASPPPPPQEWAAPDDGEASLLLRRPARAARAIGLSLPGAPRAAIGAGRSGAIGGRSRLR